MDTVIGRETLEIVFTKIRGIVGNEVGYVVRGSQRWRKYTKPVQPKTRAQRACWRAQARLVGRWKHLTCEEKAPWNALARQTGRKRITGFNMFLSYYLKKFAEQQRAREAKRMVTSGSCGRNRGRRFVRLVQPHGGSSIVSLIVSASSRAPTRGSLRQVSDRFAVHRG